MRDQRFPRVPAAHCGPDPAPTRNTRPASKTDGERTIVDTSADYTVAAAA